MTKTTNDFLPFHFQTMDSDIELLLRCDERQQPHIQEIGMDWFGREDKRFSQMLADSEINFLNTLAGESCLVSNPMLEVLFLAEMYQAVTDGNYTPLHYTEPGSNLLQRATGHLAWEINPKVKTVTLPQHTSIHLQGLEKSWSQKRFGDYLKKSLSFTDGLIRAGGDVTVWGQSDLREQEPWSIGLQNPWNANDRLGSVVMWEGALSTYSPLEDAAYDNTSDVRLCTVAGKDLVECHVWARLLCILGMEEGLSLLAKRSDSCEALMLSKDGQLHYFGREVSLGQRWLDVRVDQYHFMENRDFQGD